MTTEQELLGKILTNRINSEISTGIIESDKDISNILDVFVAGNKITMDQYTELTGLITSAATTTTNNSTENSSGSTTGTTTTA